MFSKFFYIFLLVAMCIERADFIEKTTENYGPYTLHMEKLYSCRGPKVADLTTYTSTLVTMKNVYKGAVNITFLDQTRVDDIKISVSSVKTGEKVLLWNYLIKKPCQHYAISKVFEKYVNSTNCIVKKGTYLAMLDLTEITQNYLGPSFFYGEFVLKVVALSKNGNVVCLMFHPIFKKKV